MNLPSLRKQLPLVATFAVFFFVLVAPWIAGAFGASSDTVERRAPAPRPSFDGDAVFDAATFSGLNDYIRDRTPLRGTAAGWANRAWLQLGASGDATVVEGPGATMFLAEDFTRPCTREYELDDMVDRFDAYSEAAETGGKEWLFLVASDKGAILDHRLGGRASIAATCSREARAEFRGALDLTGASVDLAPSLIAADKAVPGRWYYEHDSHWTFEGGGLVAGDIVERFAPDIYDPKVIRKIERALPINGDIYRRLSIEKTLDVPDPVRVSMRPDVTTDRSEGELIGTRTVRTYRSEGEGEVVAGRTVVVHDSMMNFVERQLAPYFEEIVFIHWDDLDKAGFFDRVADSDRVILMRVEREAHRTIRGLLLADEFGQSFVEALGKAQVEPIVPDARLATDVLGGTGALRRFTIDTGTFVQAFGDLLVNPGVDGWTGPYLTGELYEDESHPKYGEWQAVNEPEPPTGAPTNCTEFGTSPCGSWLVLFGVPIELVDQLDAEFDGSDGFTTGMIRRVEETGALYVYSLA
ncbi:MAG: hypothetical protein ACI81L_001848 [Verrucomicrobiales bacterium]|jgi:hypothetical protein